MHAEIGDGVFGMWHNFRQLSWLSVPLVRGGKNLEDESSQTGGCILILYVSNRWEIVYNFCAETLNGQKFGLGRVVSYCDRSDEPSGSIKYG